jgi:hypothetical protein
MILMSDTEWIQYAEAVERRMQRMRRAIDDMRSNAVRDGGYVPDWVSELVAELDATPLTFPECAWEHRFKSQLPKQVQGALKAAIHAHGPIDPPLISSAAKRIESALLVFLADSKHIKPNAKIPAAIKDRLSRL